MRLVKVLQNGLVSECVRFGGTIKSTNEIRKYGKEWKRLGAKQSAMRYVKRRGE